MYRSASLEAFFLGRDLSHDNDCRSADLGFAGGTRPLANQIGISLCKALQGVRLVWTGKALSYLAIPLLALCLSISQTIPNNAFTHRLQARARQPQSK